MTDVIGSVARAHAGKKSPLVEIDAERVDAAVAEGWTPDEAIHQARWMADGLFGMLTGFRRGWQLLGHNQPAVELSLWSLARDLGVAMTDPDYADEAKSLLVRINGADMQLMVMVNETMSHVVWEPAERLAP